MERLIGVVIPAYRALPLVRQAVALLNTSIGIQTDIVIVNNEPREAGCFLSDLPAANVKVVEAGRNAGFTGAINLGVRASSGDYVLFHNQDLEVTPGYLQALLTFMEEHPRAGCASGKILRLDSASGARTTTIDTAGIAIARSRRAFDRGEGTRDRGQFDTVEQVFAVSGAAMLARRSALEDVLVDSEYLDETLFMYKDDIDLCWRMRLRGWECWYLPAAVAYHGRTSKGLAGRGYLGSPLAYLRNERAKPAPVRLHSMKNQWLVLLKNEQPGNLLHDLPFVAGRELLVLGANLVTAPDLVARSLAAFSRAAPTAWRRRRRVQGRATAPPADIRTWFVA